MMKNKRASIILARALLLPPVVLVPVALATPVVTTVSADHSVVTPDGGVRGMR